MTARLRSLSIVLVLLGIALGWSRGAQAQQAKEFLVPPSGGTFLVPVHPSFATGLFFGEKLSTAVLPNVKGYAFQRTGTEGLTITPTDPHAAETNINFSTASGSMRVSVVLRIVEDTREAYTLVTFRATSEEEARQQMVADAVERETASLRAELAAARAEIDKRIRERADHMIARRLLTRLEQAPLGAVERNNDRVIVRVPRVVLLGEDAFVFFELQNRNRSPYRLARVQLLQGGIDRAAAVEFASDAQSAAEGVLGVVASGGRGTGVVAVRHADAVLGRSLRLVVSEPDGRSPVVVDGIVLR